MRIWPTPVSGLPLLSADTEASASSSPESSETSSEVVISAAAYDNDSLDRQGLNAWIWALTAANCSGEEAESGALNTRVSIAEHIISAALPDGGFSLRGERADCDMTAAAVYALAPLEEFPAAKEALAAAVDCLTALQLPLRI